jgi:hypothetical protein
MDPEQTGKHLTKADANHGKTQEFDIESPCFAGTENRDLPWKKSLVGDPRGMLASFCLGRLGQRRQVTAADSRHGGGRLSALPVATGVPDSELDVVLKRQRRHFVMEHWSSRENLSDGVGKL